MTEVMEDLKIERRFEAPLDVVFAYVTERESILKWWGPEGLTLPEESLDFSRRGPWHSVMVNAEGKRFKVSGVVREIKPPSRVEFTWAWHDDQDVRGSESIVRIELEEDGKQATRFTLIHSGLANDESRANHNMGWTSSLKKLERIFA